VEPAARPEPGAVRRGRRRAQGGRRPKDKAAVAKAISSVNAETPVGHVQFGKGPNASVVSTPIIGGQWVATGGKFALNFVLCENSSDPNVPVAAQLKPYA
jgi:branched-chain amino acid transport system substrate-binding protein